MLDDLRRNLMNRSLIFRFAVAAFLVCLGCSDLLTHGSGIGFAMLPIVTLSRSEMNRPIPSRDVLIFVLAALAMALLILVCHWLPSTPVPEMIRQVIHHPLFVLPLWILMLWSLRRLYRNQKAEADTFCDASSTQ